MSPACSRLFIAGSLWYMSVTSRLYRHILVGHGSQAKKTVTFAMTFPGGGIHSVSLLLLWLCLLVVYTACNASLSAKRPS